MIFLSVCAALLLTLAEVKPTACTSMRCTWSRPSTGSKASLAKELDFGKASFERYTFYTVDHSLL